MNILKSVGKILAKASSTLGLTTDPIYYVDTYTEKPIWSNRYGASVETLYQVIEQSPEVQRCVHILIEDILSQGFIWQDPDGGVPPDGRVKKAEKLILKSMYLKKLADALFDAFVTGDGWLLKLKFPYEEIERMAYLELTKNKIYKSNARYAAARIANKIAQGMNGKTQGLQVLRSDTVHPKYDEYGRLLKVVQRVGAAEVEFGPEDLIHISFTNIGGSNFGFTPLMPLLNDVANLILAKEYAGAVFTNKGVPPMMLNLPEAQGEHDRNVQFLKNELRKWRNNKNFKRIMITTGQINPLKLDSEAKDLEFAKLITHFTRVILSAWGIPEHRFPISSFDSKAVTPKESNEGYYKSIDFKQELLEQQLYQQLWSEFNLFPKFNRKYMVDELKNANMIAMLADRRLVSVQEARKLMDIGLPDEIPSDHDEIDPRKHDEGNVYDEDKDERDEPPVNDGDGEDNQDNKVKSVTEVYEDYIRELGSSDFKGTFEQYLKREAKTDDE